MTDYSDIIERLEKADGPSRELDGRVWVAANPDDLIIGNPRHHGQGMVQFSGGGFAHDRFKVSEPYTASLDAAIALVERLLPGWGWRIGTCYISDDAFLFPDCNCPVHGERLMKEFGSQFSPGEEWSDLTDVDLRPPRKTLAIALLISLFTALDLIERKNAK